MFHVAKRRDESSSNLIWADVVGTELHDAGFVAVSGCENRAEIKVMRENHEIVGGCIRCDFGIGSVGAANV